LPGSTSKVRSSTARTAPYCLVSPRTEIMRTSLGNGACAGEGMSS
jgi:hypothetical protein